MRSRRSFAEYGLPLFLALYVLCGGISSFLGWVFAVPRLIDWIGDGIVIKANAAACLIFAGAGLLFAVVTPGQKALIRLCGLITALVAGLTLFQHITGFNLGIDTLLFTEPSGVPATVSPGRMGVPASSSLTAIGLALIFSTFGKRPRLCANALGMAATAIAALSLGGYLFGANQLYAIPRITGIALQTATMIAALGMGMIAVVPEHGLAAALGRSDAGGAVFRRLFLPIIVVSLALGWLRVTGQEAGLFDTAFGTAARTLIEITLLLGLLWWTASDISRAEKRAGEAATALAERDIRMRGVLEALSDAFVSLGADLRFSYANAALKTILAENGRDVSDVIGKNVFAVFPEARDTALGQTLIRSMEDRTPAELEEYFAPFDRWFHARFYPTDDGGMSIFALDITERKVAERESAKLAAIVESSRDAIIGKDLNGIINSWNRGAERIFGYTSEEANGKSITMLIPNDRVEEESEILARIRRGESINHYETVRRRKDGTLLDISLTISPVVDGKGRIIGASKIARDITERKRGEAAIRDREIMARLVEAQEADRHRIARDLHDHLGQQLTAMRLKLESIKSLSAGQPALTAEIDELQRYASRIDLDISYLAWELRPTELDHLGLRDALGSFIREWSKTYDIPAEFHSTWPSNRRLTAEMETNLYRIVQESLNNILKHAAAQNVSVLLEQRQDEVVLIVEDDGIGFDLESNRQNGNKPRGLGLIGMRERTALLGGTLDIESRPKEGTTVFVRIPLTHAEERSTAVI